MIEVTYPAWVSFGHMIATIVALFWLVICGVLTYGGIRDRDWWFPITAVLFVIITLIILTIWRQIVWVVQP